MRAITRRELNQHSGRILDEGSATGESVEVTSRGGESMVISPDRGRSRYAEWSRMGLIEPATQHLDEAPRASSPRSVEEILGAIDSDH